MEVQDRHPGRARAASLLRRTSLIVDKAAVDRLVDDSWDDGVDRILDRLTITEHAAAQPPVSDDWQELLRWWLEQMTSPNSGIVDRMTWFWHGLLTTNAYKVGPPTLLRRQLSLLRSQSLGNYRTLLQSFVIDGALLMYLDGDGSKASNPNENLGRELMELFTIGRGNYSQDDVRAAARALAGWWVNDDDDEPAVVFRREEAFIAPLIFLGEQDDWTTQKIVDRLCDHPATAVRVSSRLWADLIGTPLGEDESAELGAWWQGEDLEILPLVERLLRSEAAEAARYSRPRSGMEWFAAAQAASGFELDNPWWLESLGQMPYLPPNVAGWPSGDHWLAPGSLLNRGSLVYGVDLEPAVKKAATSDDVLTACGIESISQSTQEALDRVERQADLDREGRARLRWRLALNSPEFHLL